MEGLSRFSGGCVDDSGRDRNEVQSKVFRSWRLVEVTTDLDTLSVSGRCGTDGVVEAQAQG